MTAMQSEVFEACRAVAVPEGEPPRAAAAPASACTAEMIASRAPQASGVASTKSEVSSIEVSTTALKADVGTLRADVVALEIVAGIRGEVAIPKRMAAPLLAFPVAVASRTCLH